MITGFVNGNVYLSFKPLRRAQAFVVVGDRIAYVGGSPEVERIVRAMGGGLVDLGGRTVLPGFVDSHVHLDELGINLSTVDLRGAKSLRELKQIIRDSLDRIETLWVLGHGWDQELFEEKRWPNRWDIDEVARHRPVMLTRICLHAAVLNSRALEITNISSIESPNVERDSSGTPTGLVKEDALEIAWEKVRESMSVEDYEKILLNAMRFAASQGVTTVGFMGCSPKVLKALANLWTKNAMPIRVRVYLAPGKGWENVEMLRRIGLGRGFGDSLLRVMGVKVVADGSLGARTAWLSEPYEDDPSTRGAPDISPEDLRILARRVHEAGLQLSVHGIGDRAIDAILDAYSELRDAGRARHRIEHASVIREDQVERVAKLGVAVSVQPNFVVSDWWALSRLGVKRIRMLYPFKTMVERGAAIGFGTDSPVEPINPWQTVYAAVTRGRYEGVAHYEYTKHECLGLAEALHLYTYGSAYIMLGESEVGRLEPGMLADFVIVDRDPFATEDRELKSIRVLETYVGGSRVWPA